MEPTKLPKWGVPVVVIPVRKRWGGGADAEVMGERTVKNQLSKDSSGEIKVLITP